MNCWEKLHQGIADDIDRIMCVSRTAGAMQEIDKTCLEFTGKINSLIKEHLDECEFIGFNVLFFVTDKRTEDQPLIQYLYGTKGELQKLCNQARETIDD